MNITPIKAIRMKCLDCSGGSVKEVKECPILDCSLYVYRLCKRPSDEEKKAYIERLRKDKG